MNTNAWQVLGVYLLGSALLVASLWVAQGVAAGLGVAGCLTLLLAGCIWDDR